MSNNAAANTTWLARIVYVTPNEEHAANKTIDDWQNAAPFDHETGDGNRLTSWQQGGLCLVALDGRLPTGGYYHYVFRGPTFPSVLFRAAEWIGETWPQRLAESDPPAETLAEARASVRLDTETHCVEPDEPSESSGTRTPR